MTMNNLPTRGQDEPKPQKPKHPLSAYNLFFQLERKRILNGTDGLHLPITSEELRTVSIEHKDKPKRVHRKTHGKIGFRELARTIASRWKKLDRETRQLLEKQAVVEKKEHAILHKSWKASLGPEGEQTQQNQAPQGPKAVRPRQQVEQVVEKIVQDGSNRMEVLQHLRNQIEAEMARLVGGQNAPRVVSPMVVSPNFSHRPLQHPGAPMPPLALPNQQMGFPAPQQSSLMPSDWQTEHKQEEAPTLDPRIFREMPQGGFDFDGF
mmetsp:Transcript_6811/g.17555  ORF Transcript_6811/g.17555 Transcript_6811/m.17555 type:complete len:265 (+) Transcript_6811:115-909(+)